MINKPWRLLSLLFLLLFLSMTPVFAQAQKGIRVLTEARVTEWLELAATHEENGDWGEALEVYTWLMGFREYQNVMIEVKSGVYLRVPDYLRKKILTGNAKVLDYYRIVYNGPAKRDRKAAVLEKDPERLQQVAEQYFASTEAPSCYALAGELFFERGDLQRAEVCYEHVLEYGDEAIDLLPGSAARLAVLYSLRGASRKLAALSTLDMEGDVSVQGTVYAVQDFIQRQTGHMPAASGWSDQVLSWSCYAGNSSRNKQAYPNASLGDLAWYADLERRYVRGKGQPANPLNTKQSERVFPAVNEKYIAYNTRDYVYVREFQSGRLAFLRYEKSMVPVTGQQELLPLFCTSTLAGDILITVDHVFTGGYNFVQAGTGNKIRAFDLSRNSNTLEPLWEVGGIQEQTGDDLNQARFSADMLDKLTWDFAPVVQDGVLYITAHGFAGSFPEVWVYAFHLKTGKVLWKTFLFHKEMTSRNSIQTHAADLINSLSYSEGQLYYSSDFGVVCSLQANSGHLNWLRTTGKDSRLQSVGVSGPNVMILHNGNLLHSPSERNRSVYMRHAESGVLVWKTSLPKGEIQLLGLRNDVLFVSVSFRNASSDEQGLLLALSLQDSGRELWRIRLPELITGRGVVTADAVYVPTEKGFYRITPTWGELAKDNEGRLLRRDDGRVVYAVYPDGHLLETAESHWSAHLKFGMQDVPLEGDILLAGKYIVRAGKNRLYVFHNDADILPALDQRIAAEPLHPQGYYVRGRLLLFRQEYALAAESFLQAKTVHRQYGGLSSDTLNHCIQNLYACYVRLAKTHVELGQVAQAEEFYHKALEHAEHGELRLEALLNFVMISVDQEDWMASVEWLQRMVDEVPQEVVQSDPFAKRAMVMGSKQGRQDSFLNSATFARNKIVWILQRQGDSIRARFEQRAKSELDQARRNSNLHALEWMSYKYPMSEWIDDALFESANVLIATGRLSEGLRSLHRFFSEFPDSPLQIPAVSAWIECYRQLGSVEGELRAMQTYYQLIEDAMPVVSPGGQIRKAPLISRDQLQLLLLGSVGHTPRKHLLGSSFVPATFKLVQDASAIDSLTWLRNQTVTAKHSKILLGAGWNTLQAWDIETGKSMWTWRSRLDALGAVLDDSRGELKVVELSEFSSLRRAHLQTGDVLTALDGSAIHSVTDFLRKFHSLEEGDYSIHVVRGNLPMELSISRYADEQIGISTTGAFSESGVVVLKDNVLSLLRIGNGRPKWERVLDTMLLGVSVHTGNDLIVVRGRLASNPLSTYLAVYDLFDGTEMWSRVYPYVLQPDVQVQQGSLIVRSGKKHPYVYVIDAQSGSVRYLRPYTMLGDRPAFVVSAGNLVVLEDGVHLHAYHLRTSNEMWTHQLLQPLTGSSQWLSFEDAYAVPMMILMPSNSSMTLLHGKSGELLWRDEHVFESELSMNRTRLHVVGDYVIGVYSKTESSSFHPRPREVDYLYAYELKTGKFLWGRVPIGNEKQAQVTVDVLGNDYLMVMATEAFQSETKVNSTLYIYGGGKRGIPDGKLLQTIQHSHAESQSGSAFTPVGDRFALIKDKGIEVYTLK